MSKTTPVKTILSPNSVMRGELALESDAVLMGRFDGDLRVAGTVELAGAAEVSGTIIAGTVAIAGKVDADVIAQQGVEMLAGSKLAGRLFSTRISVCEGGEYEGEINVGPEALKAAMAWVDQIKQEQEQAAQAEAQARTSIADAVLTDDEASESDQPTESNRAPGQTATQIDPSVIGSILSQRRAKVMAAANTLERVAAEAERAAG